jgi:hypothetical protein
MRAGGWFCAVLIASGLAQVCSAEVVDRVAVTIRNQVITELEIDEELRVAALLNHKPLQNDLQARRDAADRLVEQFLIRRDIQESAYPAPGQADIDNYVAQVEDDFGGSANLRRALEAYALSSEVLRRHLALQLTTLRYVEYRFRSDSVVTESDIASYYAREVAEARSGGTPAPPALEASRNSIRQILTEERTDEALNSWLEEARKRYNIVYLDRSLQ